MAASATPASAHPFGPPATARISVAGSHVALTWLASPDDLVALGVAKGAFADPAPELTGEQKLQRSTVVRDYLISKITVSQGGRPCAGQLASLVGVTDQGARFTFDCPRKVDDLDVNIGALVDLDANYRTVVTADTQGAPTQKLFTATTTTQHLSFSASGGKPATVVGLAVGLAIGVVAGIGGFVALRVRRRSKSS
ncbi:hypothetical protein [Microbispora sp. NBC_01389]|uniref:hypothetical protein n=1 Tax=Microbispora sp. NBC_01389 TaxID=2903584 RepID=UPI003250059D